MQTIKNRTFYFDNLKGLLIILVVLFHLVPTISGSPFQVLYSFVFMFHMPFFILISGYFSKNREKQARNAISLLFLYYILSLLFYIFKGNDIYIDINNIKNIEISYELFLRPFIGHNYTSWYLAVLFLLRIICPCFTNIKYYPFFAFITAIAASLIEIDQYNIRRTLMLLPFFSIGFLLNKYNYNELKKKLLNKKIAIISTIILFILFIPLFITLKNNINNFDVALFSMGDVNLDMFFSRKRYFVIYDIFYYLLSFLLIYIIASLVNNKNNILTKLGKNSLSIYFFHGFFTLPIRYHILNPLVKTGQVSMIMLAFIIALITTLVLVFIFSRDTLIKYTIDPLENFSKKFIIKKD